MSETSNLPILREENVQLIVQSGPQTYQLNSTSTQRCSEVGQQLLAEIQRVGMTDDLDRRAADFVDKAKRTVKAMNERRSPITKLFDQVRTEFTSMENAIDPSKKDTIPYQIQQYRNAYAAQKREEAERLRREEMARQQREQEINRYTQDAEDDYKRQFDRYVSRCIDELTALNQSLTLENYEHGCEKIKGYPIVLDNHWFQGLQCYAHAPISMHGDSVRNIQHQVLNRLSKQFKEQFTAEVGEYRDSIVDALPSKKRELERIAAANAEEQAKMQEALKQREAAEAARLEDERRRKEEEARAASQMQKQATEMDGLFGQAAVATPVGYLPKTSVKKRVVANSPEAILAILSFWWSKEGAGLPVDELAKMFKKQITFCDKCANDKDNPEFIDSAFVSYEEEVKAK